MKSNVQSYCTEMQVSNRKILHDSICTFTVFEGREITRLGEREEEEER